MKAIFRPSGDQTGKPSLAGSRVSLRSRAPVGVRDVEVDVAAATVGDRRSREGDLRPSGDQTGKKTFGLAVSLC